MTENQVPKIIVDNAFILYRRTGPGILERVYRDCLAHLLMKNGLKVEKEKAVALHFDDLHFEAAYRLDIIVEDKVIIEIKSTSNLMEVHAAQLLTYLKLTDKKLELLINFNSPVLKEGIRRVVNGDLGK